MTGSATYTTESVSGVGICKDVIMKLEKAKYGQLYIILCNCLLF